MFNLVELVPNAAKRLTIKSPATKYSLVLRINPGRTYQSRAYQPMFQVLCD